MRAQQPAAGLSHPIALQGQDAGRLALGITGALMAFLILVQGIAQAVLGIGWWIRGRPDFDGYRAEAMAYELPDGILASHLALGALLPAILLLYRFWHGRAPQWVVSVQPGVRWRYLVLCLLVAAAVLNVTLWLVQGGSFTWQSPQPDGWRYLLLIFVTSPLQATAEEVFFRGYLQQTVASLAGRPWVGMVISSLAFALLHGSQNAALFAHRLGFGLIAGALVWLTGGLEAAIAAHIMNNVIAFGYAVFTGGIAALKATTAIPWTVAAADLGGFAALGILAWWLAHRMRLATVTPVENAS